MQSFVIASKDENVLLVHARTLCEEQHIDAIDKTIIEQAPGERASRGGSIGIAEIRNLQKTLFLTPVKSPAKAILIKHAETLTVEAQNALLKILEEPPPTTIIVLLTENKNLLLPTILSRCKIIVLLAPRSSALQNEVGSTLNSQLSTLFEGSIGERLKLAQDVAKNKEDILPWLENMILALRREFMNDLSNPSLFPSASLRASIIHYSLFQETYVTLKTTNANPRLVLENLFLNEYDR